MEARIEQYEDGTFAVYTAYGIDALMDGFATEATALDWIDAHPRLWI